MLNGSGSVETKTHGDLALVKIHWPAEPDWATKRVWIYRLTRFVSRRDMQRERSECKHSGDTRGTPQAFCVGDLVSPSG